VLKLAASRLVFVDETGGWLGLTRLYARVVGGVRALDTAPRRRKGKVSLLAAVTLEGMNPNACLVHEGGVDRAAFLSYIEHALIPTLQAGQVVVMDNFTIHHNSKVRELIEAAECELLYLPTYSPDFNPIEHLFAKLKAFIKKLRPDTVPNLIQAFEQAVLTVTQVDAKNAFNHCSYLSQ
jgi:transposase